MYTIPIAHFFIFRRSEKDIAVVREPPLPLKGGPPLLAGTHIDMPAHT
jgi:hypothetical protein